MNAIDVPRSTVPSAALGLTMALALSITAGASAQDPVERNPDDGLRVEGMTFVGSRGSNGELVVRATHALFFPDTGIANLEEVDARVHDDDQGENFRMQCDRAQLNVETNDFTATGNVRGVTAEGQSYRVPWVRYEHDNALLLSDAPVIMVDKAGTFRGDGFRYHITERRFELLGNVTVEQGS
jgi:LPS export ABC transporter protein LptC